MAVWLLVAVGRRLPGPLFDALVTRVGAPAGEVLPIDGIDRIVEPRQVPCPCPPELLRPASGPVGPGRIPAMKRRDLIRMSDDEVAEFLRGRHTMNVATINHDGTIHMVAMWYGFVGQAPAFWTFGKSQKILNLERNPQITCLVEAGDKYEELQGVELVGRAELVPDHDGRMAIGRSVFERYLGEWSEEVATLPRAHRRQAGGRDRPRRPSRLLGPPQARRPVLTGATWPPGWAR